MKIFHIVRNNKNISLFKEIILYTLTLQVTDEVYVSSGFFTENSNKKISLEQASFGCSWSNASTRKNIIKVLVKGCYNGKQNVSNFVNSLQSYGYNAIACPYKFRHHAKVFIAQHNGTPFLEIIGSSNFTPRAYGTGVACNIEADLVICNDSKLESFIRNVVDENNLTEQVMLLDYNEDDNNGRSIEKQMCWIRDNLF